MRLEEEIVAREDFANLEGRFELGSLRQFIDSAKGLLAGEEIQAANWVLFYDQNKEVINKLDSRELGIYLISQARDILLENEGLTVSFDSAELGLAILLRIKAFNYAKEEFANQLPKNVDEMLSMLIADISLDDYLETAKTIRQIWGVFTPFAEGDRVRNQKLTKFLLFLSQYLSIAPKKTLFLLMVSFRIFAAFLRRRLASLCRGKRMFTF